MSIDTPFGSEDLMELTQPDAPFCGTCEDSGMVEFGDQLVPCMDCRPDEFDHVMECGRLDP